MRIEYEGRGDARLEGRGKYVRKESKRLSSIEMSVGGRIVRRYGFEYRENEMGESLLVKLEVKGKEKRKGMRTGLSMSRRRRIRAGNFVSSERRKAGREAEASGKVCT